MPQHPARGGVVSSASSGWLWDTWLSSASLRFPTCKMGMPPTKCWGDSVTLGPAVTEHFTQMPENDYWWSYRYLNRMMPLFAHLQTRVGVLVGKLRESEMGRERTF